MRKTLDYVRQVWQLWRTRRENPLFQATAPRRQGRFLFVAAVLQLLGGPGVLITVVAYLLWTKQLFDPPEETFIFLLLGFVVSLLFSVPVNLALFVGRWLDRSRLQDLALTPLTPREVAFGIAYRPVVLGMGMSFWLAVSGISVLSLHSSSKSWNDPDPEGLLLGAVGCLAVIALTAAVTVRFFFMVPRGRWVAMVPILCSLGVHAFGYGSLGVMGVEAMEELLPYESPYYRFQELFQYLWLGALLIPFVVFQLRLAGRMVPVRLFYTVFPEQTERFSLLHNNLGVARRPELKPALGDAVRRHVPVRWGAAAVCLAVACVVQFGVLMGTLAVSGALPTQGSFFAAFNVLTMYPLLSLALGMQLLWEGRRTGWRPLLLVSGRVEASALRRMLPVLVLWSVAVTAYVLFALSDQSVGPLQAWRGAVLTLIVLFLSVLAWVPAISTHALAMGSRRPWLWTALGAALPLAWVAWMYVLDVKEYGELPSLAMRQFSWATNQEEWGMAGIAMLGVMAFLLPFAFQRLFSRRLAGVELGELGPKGWEEPPLAERRDVVL